jgi:hypothetical protein
VTEFKATNRDVRAIAAVFELRGWTWTNKDGESVDPFVPKARDIARTLNLLYETATAPSGGNGGNCRGGRLFVQYIDEGYGKEVSFGIEWTRLP